MEVGIMFQEWSISKHIENVDFVLFAEAWFFGQRSSHENVLEM